eukprot:2017246-Amphidinium_carterae.1
MRILQLMVKDAADKTRRASYGNSSWQLGSNGLAQSAWPHPLKNRGTGPLLSMLTDKLETVLEANHFELMKETITPVGSTPQRVCGARGTSKKVAAHPTVARTIAAGKRAAQRSGFATKHPLLQDIAMQMKMHCLILLVIPH